MRIATAEDVPAIVEMGAKLHATAPFADVPYDREATAGFVGKVIEHGVVFLADGGMCGGVLSPSYFNPAHVVAAELFWWAPVGGGRELREAFERWARAAGAAAVQFSGLANDRLEAVTRVYRRGGFEPVEMSFVKRL
ncbi:MAG: hypothetical protein ACOY4K_00580 [Pseudomonadota bacterium]